MGFTLEKLVKMDDKPILRISTDSLGHTPGNARRDTPQKPLVWEARAFRHHRSLMNFLLVLSREWMGIGEWDYH